MQGLTTNNFLEHRGSSICIYCDKIETGATGMRSTTFQAEEIYVHSQYSFDMSRPSKKYATQKAGLAGAHVASKNAH